MVRQNVGNRAPGANASRFIRESLVKESMRKISAEGRSSSEQVEQVAPLVAELTQQIVDGGPRLSGLVLVIRPERPEQLFQKDALLLAELALDAASRAHAVTPSHS